MGKFYAQLWATVVVAEDMERRRDGTVCAQCFARERRRSMIYCARARAPIGRPARDLRVLARTKRAQFPAFMTTPHLNFTLHFDCSNICPARGSKLEPPLGRALRDSASEMNRRRLSKLAHTQLSAERAQDGPKTIRPVERRPHRSLHICSQFLRKLAQPLPGLCVCAYGSGGRECGAWARRARAIQTDRHRPTATRACEAPETRVRSFARSPAFELQIPSSEAEARR